VSRYVEVAEVLKHPNIFSSSIMAPFDTTLLGAEPTSHGRVRRIVSEAFSPKRLSVLEGRIRALADEFVTHIATEGRCELISDFAAPLPLAVIADMLGISSATWTDLKRWSSATVASATGTPTRGEMVELSKSMNEFARFMIEHVNQCRSGRNCGVLSDLMAAVDEEDRLSSQELVSFVRLLLIAGNETTTNLIGNTIVALLKNPDDLEVVQANPQLIPALIEEVLRYDSPVQFVQRIVQQEVELCEVLVPTKGKVMALLGSANRDPAQFPNPDEFQMMRSTQGHLGFGIGPHFCLGAYLARLEARVALETLLARLPGLRAREPLEYIELVDSIQLRGPKRLELAFGPLPARR
jgi:cytochrome P450